MHEKIPFALLNEEISDLSAMEEALRALQDDHPDDLDLELTLEQTISRKIYLENVLVRLVKEAS